MTKPKPQIKRPLRGTAAPAEVIVGDRRKVIGMVTIENHGRDERGALVGRNGIRWVGA